MKEESWAAKLAAKAVRNGLRAKFYASGTVEIGEQYSRGHPNIRIRRRSEAFEVEIYESNIDQAVRLSCTDVSFGDNGTICFKQAIYGKRT